MDHLITADETDTIEVHSAWLDWTMTLSQLFDHDDAEQITKIATEIRDTNTGAFDASELLQRLEHLDEPFQSKHWIFSSPLIMFCFLAIGILLTFCIWKKFCTKSLTAPDPPAPPAAAPYIPAAPTPMAQQHEQPPPSVQNPAPMQESAPTTFNFKKSPPKSITIINS
jgi:hypothetical protein